MKRAHPASDGSEGVATRSASLAQVLRQRPAREAFVEQRVAAGEHGTRLDHSHARNGQGFRQARECRHHVCSLLRFTRAVELDESARRARIAVREHVALTGPIPDELDSATRGLGS